MVLNWRKALVLSGVIGLLAGIFILAGCSGDEVANGEANESAMSTETCVVCHDDTTLISGKQNQYALTSHVTGSGWYYAGPRAACTNCHSSEGFTEMIAMGTGVEDGVNRADASPMDCRTCHDIHTTYTEADWALTTTAPVTLIASGETYDGGNGNLCVSCHQPRRAMEVGDNGLVNVSSTHWGPHHGPQAAVLLGVGGAGDVTGKSMAHYSNVNDTCAACHVRNDNHLFSPSLNGDAINNCAGCHTDASNFDIDGVQTEVKSMIAELAEALEWAGLLDEEGEPVVGEYPEDQAAALWNYIMLEIEDGSYGVHNPKYTIDLLEYSIGVFH